jgi:multicomponent Na+:H+ antiporter subunit D
MSANLIILPILIPMATALVGLLRPASYRYQQIVGVGGAALLLVATIAVLLAVMEHSILVLRVGGWDAPWGIALVADKLAASMLVVSALIAFTTTWYSLRSVTKEITLRYYFPLVHFLMMGVNGAFVTGDLFNLYVWFEVMLIASFVLMVQLGRTVQLEGGFKYVTINILASFIFLSGIGILYGKVGSLNMADIARVLMASDDDAVFMNTTVVLLVVAFGIKSAIFPLFFWLPASYHTLPAGVAALFAGLLTKVGVYSYMRSFTLFFNQSADLFGGILLVLAAATMVTGVLGAASQFHIKRVLSFHIISQIGYILYAMALFTPFALGAAIFYTIHHIVVKSNLFLISGLIANRYGLHDLKRMGGLYQRLPLLAILFAIPALSLGGIPPLSGFWAKLAVIRAAVEADAVWVAVIAVLVGVLTLYSMTKIWTEAFWKGQPEGDLPKQNVDGTAVGHRLDWVPCAVLAAVTVFIGLFPEPLMRFSMEAGAQLLQPEQYIETVLQSTRPH